MSQVVKLIPLTGKAVEDVRRCRDWMRRQHSIDMVVRRAFPDARELNISYEGPPIDTVTEWLNVLTYIVEEFEKTKGGA